MKKLLKSNPFLLFFFLIFLFFVIFFNSNLKNKFASRTAKIFLNKVFKMDAKWEKINIKIFPPRISFDNFTFPYGKIEKISISPSYKFACTKVFIYGMELNLKNKAEGKGQDYGLIFLEDLILQKCKIKFEDKEVPLEGNFQDLSIFFLKDKGLIIIKEAKIFLPEIKELKFSLKSSFEKRGNNLFFKKIFIKSDEFKINAEGELQNLKPTFSFNFDLKANLKYFLDFLKAGIDGKCNLKGNISYKNDIMVKAEGEIEGTKFLEKSLPKLKVISNLNSKYLNLDLIRDNSKGKIILSLKEKNLSEFGLNIDKINIKEILSFFSIPLIEYSKNLEIEGVYNFYGTKIEKGDGFINFSSFEKNFQGNAILKDFSIESMDIKINDQNFTGNLNANLPFSSNKNFYLKGEIKDIYSEELKKILKPFLPELGILKGMADGNFDVSGTYEKVLISASLNFKDFYYDEIPFGDGGAEIKIQNENVEFKNIFFTLKDGTLKGSGDIKKGIDFSHKNWHFPIPFNSILNGEGKMIFEPSFLISGSVKDGKIDKIYRFDNLNFSYDYDGKVFNLYELEGIKGKGVLKAKGQFKEKFTLQGEVYDFPLIDDFLISSQVDFEIKEKDIKFCARGLINSKKLPFMPLSFYSSLNETNFELELKNSDGFEFKTNGFLDKNFNFRSYSNFQIENLELIPSLKFEPNIKGEANISGNFYDFKKINGQISIEPFNFIYKDSPFKISNGIVLEVKEGNIYLKETPIFHELAYIELYGNCSFAPKLKLKIFGQADFGDEIVNYFIPELQYDGMASLNFSLEKAKDTKMEGNLNISGYKLSYKPLNFNLLNPKGKIKLKENKIEIEYILGYSGDGKFSLNGEAILGKKFSPERIFLTGKSDNLKISYIQGFVMFLDGTANLLWTEKSKQISGNFTLLEGDFTKEFNLLSEMQKIITPQRTEILYKDLPHINLNLNIDVPQSLKVKNQILNLVCSGKIQILGDISNPIILGQIETLPKSEIYFNGVLYKIEYAKAIASNPLEFDPVIDMEAISNIRSYLIHLKIKGTLSHLNPQFSSEPYLPEADIISLLATGKVASQESGTWLSGASLLISQQISEELSKRSSSIFGLDRIRIEPVFGETSITTARITALKQINPNCTLSYTYNPIESQKDIISLECNVSQNTYLSLMQEEDGTYSLQIFQRKNL